MIRPVSRPAARLGLLAAFLLLAPAAESFRSVGARAAESRTVDVDSLRARIDRMFVPSGSDSVPGGVVGIARARRATMADS